MQSHLRGHHHFRTWDNPLHLKVHNDSVFITDRLYFCILDRRKESAITESPAIPVANQRVTFCREGPSADFSLVAVFVMHVVDDVQRIYIYVTASGIMSYSAP